MAATLQEQEARRDHLSAGIGAISIDLDYSTAGDVTPIHHVTAGHVDSVWVRLNNDTATAVDCSIVCNPSDDTDTAQIDAVTLVFSVPAKGSVWALEGECVRLRGTNTAAVTAYVATADAGKVRASGYVVRVKAESIY